MRVALSRALLARGVFAHGIRPPTVPAGTGRIRATAMATHSDADIDDALAAFAACAAQPRLHAAGATPGRAR